MLQFFCVVIANYLQYYNCIKHHIVSAVTNQVTLFSINFQQDCIRQNCIRISQWASRRLYLILEKSKKTPVEFGVKFNIKQREREYIRLIQPNPIWDNPILDSILLHKSFYIKLFYKNLLCFIFINFNCKLSLSLSQTCLFKYINVKQLICQILEWATNEVYIITILFYIHF